MPNSVWVDASDLPYSDHQAFGGRIVITDDVDENQAKDQPWPQQ